MKRFLVALLAVFYLAAGAGFTLRQHYCMGQLTGTAIDHPVHHADSHHCARCGMEQKSDDNGCCKDKVKTFKSSPDQITAKALQAPAQPFVATLPRSFPALQDADFGGVNQAPSAPAHGPPLICGIPIYLRVRCLRL